MLPPWLDQIEPASVDRDIEDLDFRPGGQSQLDLPALVDTQVVLDNQPTVGRNGEELPLHERIKAAISVRDFVSHYVDLSASGSGLCPFHDDQMASFSVNDDRNYWYCFACETGSSIIDFWMNYRECEFKVAVEELAEMLL